MHDKTRHELLHIMIYLFIGGCVYVIYQHGDIHFVCGLGYPLPCCIKCSRRQRDRLEFYEVLWAWASQSHVPILGQISQMRT